MVYISYVIICIHWIDQWYIVPHTYLCVCSNNTVMMMEMQNTIQDLQQELTALGGSKPMSTASRVSTATATRELQVEPTIIFSRSDSERNQKALKRGISAQRVSKSLSPSGLHVGERDHFRLGLLRSGTWIFSPLLSRKSSGFTQMLQTFLPENGYLKKRGKNCPQAPPPPPPHSYA